MLAKVEERQTFPQKKFPKTWFTDFSSYKKEKAVFESVERNFFQHIGFSDVFSSVKTIFGLNCTPSGFLALYDDRKVSIVGP